MTTIANPSRWIRYGNPTIGWVNYSKPVDATRTPDTTGYVKRFLDLVPTVNNYDVGDGLNTGGHRWVRTNKGIDNVYGLGRNPEPETVQLPHRPQLQQRASSQRHLQLGNEQR